MSKTYPSTSSNNLNCHLLNTYIIYCTYCYAELIYIFKVGRGEAITSPLLKNVFD